MKKTLVTITKLMVAALLITGLVACEAEEKKKTASGAPYTIAFEGVFSPDYSGPEGEGQGIKVIDAGGSVLATSNGAMALNSAGDSTLVTSDGPLGTTAINFNHNGESWGGAFFKLATGDAIDMSDVTTIKVAIKGGLPTNLGWLGLQVITTNEDPGVAQEYNIAIFDAAIDGEWTVYSFDAANYDAIDWATFIGAGIWNPNESDSTDASVREQNPYVAFTDTEIQIAFE